MPDDRNAAGRKRWIIPDGFLPERSSGEEVSHEAICVLNTGENDAKLEITVYFEDRGPLRGLSAVCPAERTNHIRLDELTDDQGRPLPTGVPYALRVISNEPVVVQHSRMDTSQKELALMSVIGYGD